MTPKQKKLLDFIKVKLSETQVCPSYQEMADALGLKSRSGVHRLVHALLAHGEIERVHGMARSIALPTPEKQSDAAKWVKVSRIAKDMRLYRLTRDEAANELLMLSGRR
jgi:SOS-response transcriptional repressor LexA